MCSVYNSRRRALLVTLIGSSAMLSVPAAAQTANSDLQGRIVSPTASLATLDTGDIVVTARKREESLIAVPIAITAVGSAELSRGAINSVDSLARKIPGLIVGEGGGTPQGGSIALRGISAADTNPIGDQAVSFNIDGVQVARASVRRMGEFDISQVEVLKGPQALFFGKNSPGGIVSTRTNDPGPDFEIGGRIGYEFAGKEIRGEGYVSAPLADGLGARIAIYGSDLKGWVKNVLPAGDPLAPKDRSTPDAQEWAVRGTLKFENGSPFRARLKLTHNELRNNGVGANYQFVDCPTGSAPFAPFDDCKANNRLTTATLGTGLSGVSFPQMRILKGTDFKNGEPYSKINQTLAGLELNYDVSDVLKFTSITGYYSYDYIGTGNFNLSSQAPSVLAGLFGLKIKEKSQELRLASDFDGPIDFLVGGQYQKANAKNAALAVFGVNVGGPSLFGPARPSPFVGQSYYVEQNGTAYSVFAQLQIKPIPTLEISAGGRLSSEKKTLASVLNRGVEQIGLNPNISGGKKSRDYDNFSPDITLSYRPSTMFTLYGTYKQGFLSGGFNGGAAGFSTSDISYKQQIVKGYEAGAKGRFFRGLVNAELALYSYKITDLQVAVTVGVTQELRNAGKVSSKGGEFNLSIKPADGLDIYGNISYLKGRYRSYYASCYAGQIAVSPGTGIGQCAVQPNPTAGNLVGTLQNLGGTPLVRAPEWTGNAGFTYIAPISDSMRFEISGGLSYSDSYITTPTSQPRSRQPSYTMLNGSVRLIGEQDRWDISVIGNNLTDKSVFVRGTDNPSSAISPNRLAETIAVAGRGREVFLRVGLKY